MTYLAPVVAIHTADPTPPNTMARPVTETYPTYTGVGMPEDVVNGLVGDTYLDKGSGIILQKVFDDDGVPSTDGWGFQIAGMTGGIRIGDVVDAGTIVAPNVEIYGNPMLIGSDADIEIVGQEGVTIVNNNSFVGTANKSIHIWDNAVSGFFTGITIESTIGNIIVNTPLTVEMTANTEINLFTNLFLVSGPAGIGDSSGTILLAAGAIGFYGGVGTPQQTVTGAKGGNAALASLLTILDATGLIVDHSS